MLEILTNTHWETLDSWMQYYLREMAQYYGDAPDKNGRYRYPYLPLYFSESDRYAFAIVQEGCRVGFLLVNHVCFVGQSTDYSLAEFTVFPQYRGQGRAQRAVHELMKKMPGTWQLKYSTDNPAAAALWQQIGAAYSGKTLQLPGNEALLVFDSRKTL